MEIRWRTLGGYQQIVRGDFVDPWHKPCVIQDGRTADDGPVMWLGRADIFLMTMTPDMVAALLPALRHFAETGRLPQPEKGGEA